VGIKDQKPEASLSWTFSFMLSHSSKLGAQHKRKSPTLRVRLLVFVAGAGFEPTTFGL
jgi:hypothetical protein